MHFDANRDAEIVRVVTDLMKRFANLSQCGVQVTTPGHSVGPHLDSRRAHVVRQPHVFLGPVDVLAHDRRVGRVVFECTAQPGKLNRRILESLAHVFTLLL